MLRRQRPRLLAVGAAVVRLRRLQDLDHLPAAVVVKDLAAAKDLAAMARVRLQHRHRLRLRNRQTTAVAKDLAAAKALAAVLQLRNRPRIQPDLRQTATVTYLQHLSVLVRVRSIQASSGTIQLRSANQASLSSTVTAN
jgi:hypothetical protein